MIDDTNRLTDLTDLLNRPEHRDKSLKYKSPVEVANLQEFPTLKVILV